MMTNQIELSKQLLHKNQQNNRKHVKKYCKKFGTKCPSPVDESMTQALLRNHYSCLKTKKVKRFGNSQKKLLDNLKKYKIEEKLEINVNTKLNELEHKIQGSSSVNKSNNRKSCARNQDFKIKLQEKLSHETEKVCSKNKKLPTLRECMMQKLRSARFRYINEQMYSQTGKDAQMFFKKDPQSFKAYHEGYQQQVHKWPLNPVDNIIRDIQKMPISYVIADLGCGDAKIAKSVKHTVHSFDLVALNDFVTTCDMANLPLQADSIDVVIFCLSLMGTNLQDYLYECNRVLKLGGIMKIVEVESRVDNIEDFIKRVHSFGFNNTWKDFSHNLFYFLDFKKVSNVRNKKILSNISLKPCIYKKR